MLGRIYFDIINVGGGLENCYNSIYLQNRLYTAVDYK